MFHEGSLQSGISRAIQEQKLVACFVRDDGEESAAWENEWLQNGWISSLLSQKAVLLRIEAGSTEAGFLAAFCPVETIPTFIVIENGQLREQLVGGISKEDFINRIRTALGASAIPGVSQPSHPPAAPISPHSAQSPSPNIPQNMTPASASPPAPAVAPQEFIPVSPILPPSSKAKGKQKVTPTDDKASEKADKAAQAARDALRKKKQEEKEELARIKARIEADKAERKAQAEARKAERERQVSENSTASPVRNQTSTRGSQAKDVRLNVRLFDGRTIHSTFPRTAKLQDDVRPWIDSEFAARAENPREKHPPYYFRQILAPQPSRELSAGEESETLGDIDLAPSATLVLVPIKGYTEAYSGDGGGLVSGVLGGVTSLVGGVFGLAYNAVGYVGGALGSVTGQGAGNQGSTGQTPEQPAPGRSTGDRRPGTPSDPGIRVRTLADQREGESRSNEFYNGNQVSALTST